MKRNTERALNLDRRVSIESGNLRPQRTHAAHTKTVGSADPVQPPRQGKPVDGAQAPSKAEQAAYPAGR